VASEIQVGDTLYTYLFGPMRVEKVSGQVVFMTQPAGGVSLSLSYTQAMKRKVDNPNLLKVKP
jgi:hypothetical protein